jgi:uncharacterized integral membrane protein
MSDDADGIERSSSWNWKLIAAGVAALLALLFILQNRAQGKIYFLFFDVTVGVWVALLVAFVLGLVVGAFLPRLVRGRRD